MPNLRCHDYTCIHNHAGCCGKDKIKVSFNARCSSYDFNNGETKSDMELAEDIANSNCISNNLVSCEDINCKNNDSRTCCLDNLRIDRISNSPQCVNERPKKCNCGHDNCDHKY